MFDWPLTSWFLLSVSVMLLAMAARVMTRRSVQGMLAFAGLLIACGLYTCGFALELALANEALTEWCESIQYLGALAIPPLLMCFTADFTGHGDWLGRRVRSVLFAQAGLSFAIKLVDPWFGLIHKSFSIEIREGLAHRRVQAGVLVLDFQLHSAAQPGFQFDCDRANLALRRKNLPPPARRHEPDLGTAERGAPFKAQRLQSLGRTGPGSFHVPPFR